MTDDNLNIWAVETGDKFERNKGTADVFEVTEIEETPGFGTPVRKVTLSATEYNAKAAAEDVPGAADVTLQTNADEECPQFHNEFSEVQ